MRQRKEDKLRRVIYAFAERDDELLVGHLPLQRGVLMAALTPEIGSLGTPFGSG